LVVAVVTVAVFALLAQFGENGIVAWWQLRGREAALRDEVAELARANAALKERLRDLAEDPEALERLAREEYGMRRADEEVLTVVPAERSRPVP
jgi:cell division protein FtsB